jgi:hypothetical protein
MKKLLLLLFLPGSVFAFSANDGAKTVTSDGSASDTNAAVAYIDGKNADGWVLTIGQPNGNYSWGSDVNFGIKDQTWRVQGASPSERPTITISSQCNVTGGGPEKTVTIADVKWRGSGGAIDGLLQLGGTVGAIRNYRVTNCEFLNQSGGSRDIFADAYGLIDNCKFLDSGQTASIYCRNTAIGWSGTMSFGTEQAVFVEDCEWVNDVPDPGLIVAVQAVDGIDAFRAVIRHNKFTNCNTETHGRSTGYLREGLQVEVYSNTYNWVGSSEDAAGWFCHVWRGGSGVAFDNDVNFSGGFWSGGWMFLFRAEQPEPYRANGQPGTGMVSNNVIGSVPIYHWNNRKNGSVITTGSGNFATQEGKMVENTDYFVNTERPGYTPYMYPHPLRGTSPQPTPTPAPTATPPPMPTATPESSPSPTPPPQPPQGGAHIHSVDDIIGMRELLQSPMAKPTPTPTPTPGPSGSGAHRHSVDDIDGLR